jgi:uncharacterized protein (DUF1778 family)
MLAFATYDASGPRDDRMEQRISKADKGLIERAAALQGLKSSEFVTSAAVTAARDTLSRLGTTVLKAEDVAAFMQAFEDAPPNKELTDLFRLHKEVSGT